LDHCGTKLFSACLSPAGTHRDGVRHAVVFHDARISDGDIRSALFKGVLGIAAGLEERSDQVVGFSDRGLGVIDEAGLHGLPLGDESFPLDGAEFADLQCVYAGFTVGQFCSRPLREEPCSRTARSYSDPKRVAEGLRALCRGDERTLQLR
jgi:hypothetical protein